VVRMIRDGTWIAFAALCVLADKPFFKIQREHTMKNLIAISAGLLIASTAAFAQPMSSGRAEIMSSVPNNSVTVTDWYKQNVYVHPTVGGLMALARRTWRCPFPPSSTP
jgi:hypothetical protein